MMAKIALLSIAVFGSIFLSAFTFLAFTLISQITWKVKQHDHSSQLMLLGGEPDA